MYKSEDLDKLNLMYDKMQNKYGDTMLNCIYGGGKINSPKFAFCFMNPTGKNVATIKSWNGIRYPWLGTKQIWKFLKNCGLFDTGLSNEIQLKKACEWDNGFASKVYDEVINNDIYITNLAKCTQLDARHLDDKIYETYLELFFKEISIIKPKVLILFGSQISSIVLNKKIEISKERKCLHKLNIDDMEIDVYCVFYPVGNGFFNVDKSIEDIKFIKEKYFKE